jgi:hypothetical protein
MPATKNQEPLKAGVKNLGESNAISMQPRWVLLYEKTGKIGILLLKRAGEKGFKGLDSF